MTDRPVIDPQAWLRLSDRDLGFLLLAQFAETTACKMGLPIEMVSVEFMERVRQHVLTLKAESAKLAPVELALHAVASGDPERAGRLFRQMLNDGANALVFERFTVGELQRRAVARKKGGKHAAQSRRAGSRKHEIIVAAEKLRKAAKPRSTWRGIIAKQLNLTPQYVGRVLSEAKKKRT